MLPVHAPFVWAMQSHPPALSLAQWCALGTRALTTPPLWLGREAAAGPSTAPALAAVQVGSRVPSARASLAVRLLAHSADAEDFTARWNLLNDAIACHHATRLEWQGTGALRLRHAYRASGSQAPSSRWLVAGAVAASLSRLGIRVALGGLEFSNETITGRPLALQERKDGEVVMELAGAASGAQPTQPTAPDLPASAPATLQPVLRALLQEPGEPWPLERAAAHAGVSPRSLQRVLASETVTWPQVVRALRVQVAGDMVLERDDASLTWIAHAAGFSDLAHLSRCFHAAAGLSPSTYRAMAHRRGHWRCVMA